MGARLSRRDFLASSLVTVGAALAGPVLWRRALAAPAQTGASPYGPLMAADANGVRLPAGFTSRIIANSQSPVPGTSYVWHTFPDGGHVFGVDEGGWIYVSNSEVPGGLGGAGALRFDAAGEIVDAYAILTGTSSNCAGGPTPWGTWLSCEEFDDGNVWECDPFGKEAAIRHPAMGTFSHESGAIDPERQRVFLTEDEPDGRLYRFTPDAYPNLGAGLLEVTRVHDIDAVTSGGKSDVSWLELPDPAAASAPTRSQVAESSGFDGGEGTWYESGVVYFTTKGDNRVWALDTVEDTIELVYDDDLTPEPPLTGVDNILMSQAGDLYVAEDGGDLQIVVITPERTVAPLLQLSGSAHEGSEIAGPALTPAHDRMYFSSQRGGGPGITFEVSGPFRKTLSQDAGDTPKVTPAPTTTPGDTAPGSGEMPSVTDAPRVGGISLPATGAGLSTALGLSAAAAAAAAVAVKRHRDEDD